MSCGKLLLSFKSVAIDLISMHLLVLFSLKKGDLFSGTATKVFLWTPEASIQAKERHIFRQGEKTAS